MDKFQLMEHEPVGKLILRLSPPIMFSLLIQALYNIVDSIFIAHLSQSALTAISFVFPIQLLMTAFATGTGVGISTLVSKFYGKNNKKAASDVARHGILLGIANWLMFAVIGLLIIKPYFMISSKSIGVISDGITYSSIILLFSIGIFMESNFTKILQAAGNMVVPMSAQLIGTIINIILNPILIFGMFGFTGFGIRGSAISTVIGQSVAMIITFKAVCKSGILESFKFKIDFNIIKNIYRSGFPSIVMQSLYTVYIVGLNLILSSFTENAVIVLGIYYKLQTFFFIPIFGIQQSVMPIMSYNFGAKHKSRLWDTFKYACLFSVIFLTIGMLIFILFPKSLINIFSTNSEILRMGVGAFRIIGLSFIPATFSIMIPVFFQAIGLAKESVIITLLRQILLLVPLAYLFSYWGLSFVWLTFPITELMTMTMAITLLFKNSNRINDF